MLAEPLGKRQQIRHMAVVATGVHLAGMARSIISPPSPPEWAVRRYPSGRQSRVPFRRRENTARIPVLANVFKSSGASARRRSIRYACVACCLIPLIRECGATRADARAVGFHIGSPALRRASKSIPIPRFHAALFQPPLLQVYILA